MSPLSLRERLCITLAVELGMIVVQADYAKYGSLIRLNRQPHSAYPTCSAREYPVSRRWERHPEFAWCPERARWQFGEMPLCTEHATQLALGIRVIGVPLDGKWLR
jgi:hypothetical protein